MIFSLAGHKKRYMTAESVKNHVSYISFNSKKIKEINLSDNVFYPEACDLLFSAIKKCTNLKKVTLSRIFSGLQPEVMQKSFKKIILCLSAPTLTHFDISQNAISCDFPECFVNFLKQLENLRVIRIDDCGLGAIGIKVLFECLNTLKNKKNLEVIDISKNRITKGAHSVGEIIKDFVNLEEIYIQYNNIDGDTLVSFLKNLAKLNLTKLDLRDNILNLEGCALLGKYFVTWDLNDLRLSDCLIDDECLKAFTSEANATKNECFFAGGFYKRLIGMTLDLSNNKISTEGLEYLKDFFENNKMKKILLYNNEFDDCSAIKEELIKKGCEVCDCESEESSEVCDSLVKKMEAL
ncbi:hypothetical protein EDEG_00084 [Edhazardia aedis USNM 41457]|uniref:Ran GTPase-activating protein 1 n=1 Tax=Edhazardia aedis (strain USNM 41457) TaxID=1003232 RepID=J9DUI9_EDHAE|nr:hypothetical protein EDEG_00084 [Edhazardia aedis USNM 41457]|eukprot:EJW04967.1 hypothetical protein EDEG_00084 [Edhazardia aedis USNM 41457]